MLSIEGIVAGKSAERYPDVPVETSFVTMLGISLKAC